MIKNRQIFLLITMLMPALTISCNNEEDYKGHSCGSTFTAYITSADLLKLKYKTGSYWVFIDSVSNTTDSVCVIGSSSGFIYDDCYNAFENHSFGTVSYPSMKQTGYIVVAGGLFKEPNGLTNSGTQIYNDYATAIAHANFLTIPHDSVFVFNQYYKKVLQVQVDNDATENNDRSIYYINSEYGFLRHDIYNDTGLVSQKILMRGKVVR